MDEHRKTKIGFIGLGLMGAAMVQRLQNLGYPVTVIAHRNRKPIDDAVKRGATEVKTAGEMAELCEIIMICVDTSASVESVMRCETGILSQFRPGTLVIDFGTSLPASTKSMAKECSDKGGSMMDAPLGRTPVHAVDGLLNIMAGGDVKDFNRAKPILEDLGENVFHIGAIGTGHTLKIINNFFAMTTACAMSEAFAMADLAGLRREMLYNVMAAGPLKSGMMDFIKANAVDNDPGQLAFSIENGLKDVGYYSKMADEFNVHSHISPSVENVLSLAKSSGWGKKYVPEMVDFIASHYVKD